jgi:hypothetical protein
MNAGSVSQFGLTGAAMTGRLAFPVPGKYWPVTFLTTADKLRGLVRGN